MAAAFGRIPLGQRTPASDAARQRAPSFFESTEPQSALYPHLAPMLEASGFEASAVLPLMSHQNVLGVLAVHFARRREFPDNERSLLATLSELCGQALERAHLLAAETQARAAAEAANGAKDEFLAMLGHELRNPLAPILTALRLVQLRGHDDSMKEHALIERQVTHLVQLVDDLLDVSRITRGKLELRKARCELGAVVNAAVELASPLLDQRRHHLSVAVPSEGLALDGDATRLAQIVANLLTNSAQYTEPGGHIQVTASRQGACLLLAVRDDGVGITAELLPRVFDLFSQERQSVDRSLGGLGLGLAIARSLATMHGGTVTAASDGPGKGSVFTLELPVASAADVRRIPTAAASAADPSRAARRVLVVDDNEDAAAVLVLAELLQVGGHVTEVAHDGPEALRLANLFKPDFVLLDIGLPLMAGYEVARRLRALPEPLRLIALTGYGREADIARTRSAGFDFHLVKPIEMDELFAALH